MIKRRFTANLFDRSARAAFVAATVTLVSCALGFRSAVGLLDMHLRKEPVALRQPLATIPRVLGHWQAEGDDVVLDAAQAEALGTEQYLNRRYAHEDDPGRVLTVHIAYYTGMVDAVPHIPRRCYVGAGWEPRSQPADEMLTCLFPGARPDPARVNRDGLNYQTLEVVHPLTGRREPADLPFGALELRTQVFGLPDTDRLQHAGYFFIANHHATVSPTFIRRRAFSLSQSHAYFVKVQIGMTGSPRDDPGRFVEVSSDLIEAVLPHLMLRLPDWAAVEAREVAGANE